MAWRRLGAGAGITEASPLISEGMCALWRPSSDDTALIREPPFSSDTKRLGCGVEAKPVGLSLSCGDDAVPLIWKGTKTELELLTLWSGGSLSTCIDVFPCKQEEGRHVVDVVDKRPQMALQPRCDPPTTKRNELSSENRSKQSTESRILWQIWL